MVEPSASDSSILGLSTTELAGLSVAEITGNETAIKMMMHYYKRLVDENAGLRNETNTLKTYVQAYERSKSDATVSAALLVLANLMSGYGINLLSREIPLIVPGIAAVVIAIAMSGMGIYFSLRERQR